MKLTPEEQSIINELHAAWQERQKAARAAETAIRGATFAEAREAAVEAARAVLTAWKTGHRPGRPITADRAALRAKARDMRAGGHSYSAISKALGIARSTIQRWVN